MTREEAIERIKAWNLDSDDMEVLAAAIPELKESEDERIIEEIKFAVMQMPSSRQDTKNRCLAYLEKQKDLDKMIVVSPEVWDNAISDAFENGKKECEKQKENPKSADSIPSDCTSDAKYEDRWHKVGDSLPDNGREVLAKDKLGNTLLARYDGEGWDVSVYDDADYRCHNGISKWCEIPSEKQKERGPLTKEEEYILHRIIEYLEDETCPSEWISLLHDIYCLPYEKQKEQKPKFYPGDVIKCTSTGSLWVRCKDGDNIRSDGHTACIGGGYELASKEEAVQFFQELNGNGYQWDCIKGRPMKKEQKPVEFPTTDEEVNEFLETHPKVEVPEKYKTPDFVFKKQEYESHPIISKDTTSVKPAEWNEDYNEENIQTRFAFYTYKDEPSTLYLSNVFVEESSRNHGFGTRILKAAEKVAEAIGAITISLKVKQNSPANAWYRKSGYGYVSFEDGYDWLEKNLEYMKPNKQEWSKEDADMLNCCISSIEEAKENRYAYKETDGDTSYDREIDWLKSLRPQSKQEWSEEDERILKGIIGLIDHDQHYGVSNNEMISWLKTLRPQLKQKWSEEDKKMLWIIQLALTKHPITDKQEKDAFDWLNSLRPQPHTVSIKNATKFGNPEYERGVKDGIQSEKSHQWKPSEEQMNALIYALQVMNTDLSPIAARTYQGLQEIQQNLKKLM